MATTANESTNQSDEQKGLFGRLAVWPLLWGVAATLSYFLIGAYAMIGGAWAVPMVFLLIVLIVALQGHRSRKEKSAMQRLERFPLLPAVIFTVVALLMWLIFAGLPLRLPNTPPVTFLFLLTGGCLAAFTFRVIHGKGDGTANKQLPWYRRIPWTLVTGIGGVVFVLLLTLWGNYMLYCEAWRAAYPGVACSI